MNYMTLPGNYSSVPILFTNKNQSNSLAQRPLYQGNGIERVQNTSPIRSHDYHINQPLYVYNENIKPVSRPRNDYHYGQTGRTNTNLRKISTVNNLNIALLNSHSVQSREKRIGIANFVVDKNIDIFFITETWLNSSGEEGKLKELTPSRYKVKSLPRGSRGGGILVIYKDHLPITIKSDFLFDHNSFEILQLSLTSPQHVHFFCLYRTPPSKKNRLKNSDFLNEFPDLLDHVNLLRGKSIISGDFNVQFNNKNHYLTKQVLDLTDSFDFQQAVNNPTFYRSGNIVDWVLYKECDNLLISCELNHLLSSDHAAVVCQMNLDRPPRLPIFKKIREIKNINIPAFKADVKTLVDQHGANITADIFDAGLRNILDKHAPAVEKKVSDKNDPWIPPIADELRHAKQLRRRAERRQKKTGLNVDFNILKERQLEVVKIIDIAKENYLCTKIKNSKDSKSFYRSTNQILGKTSEIIFPNDISEKELPEIFSNFFSNKIDLIRQKLDEDCSNGTPLYADSPHSNSQFTSFHTVTQEEVKRIISSSSKKTCSLDPIPTSLLIICLDEILPAVTIIINNSLQSGVVPDIYKHAVITPLIKKQSLDQNVLKNYRPISNLSFISKILERIVLSQMNDYLQQNNLYPKYQSAYRPSHSTETALLDITNHIFQSLDSGNLSILALLDLSAAFDTIDHHILLNRLTNSYGISSTPLSWISSYLTHRLQTVKTNNHTSPSTTLKYGVPQGSVLGPILFLLYTKPINDIISNKSILSQSFADDTQLHSSCPPDQLKDTVLDMEECISNVKDWMLRNKLKINDDKTEILLIHPKHLSNFQVSSLSVGNSEISFTKEVRNLGVTLTETMNMNKHISNVCKSAYCELRRIAAIRHLLSVEATKTLICSLIFSKLDYCNSLLVNIPKHQLQKLQRVQNSAARLIFKLKRSEHITPFLKDLHWLPINARIKYKISNLCFKSIKDPNFPPYLTNHLKTYVPPRTLRSSTDNRTLVVPRTSKSVGDRSISFSGPSIWNSLPIEIRKADSSFQFKKSLKTHLFCLSYNV